MCYGVTKPYLLLGTSKHTKSICMKVVIIGDGATGTAVVEEIRRVNAEIDIVMIADEPNPSYFRAALTNYLLGELSDRQLQAVSPDFYQKHRVKRYFGRANDVLVEPNRVEWQTPEGQRYVETFDKAVISTGSTPSIPPSYKRWMHLPWVRTLRTLVDAKEIEERLEKKKIQSAVIVGGGPLALEWVAVFRRRNVPVHLVLRSKESLMRENLDAIARDLLLARMRAEGVQIHIDEIKDIMADATGNIHTVACGGVNIQADFVGVALGIVPNSTCARNTGIRMHKNWIMINGVGQTTHHDVYAGGDVASVMEQGSLGLWGPARVFGMLIGKHITSQTVLFYNKIHYFATRLYDLDCVFSGKMNVENAKIVSEVSPNQGAWGYKRLVVEHGLLVGFLCLGEVKENVRKQARLWYEIMVNQIQVRDILDSILEPSFDLDSWIAKHIPHRGPGFFDEKWEEPAFQLTGGTMQVTPPGHAIVHKQTNTSWNLQQHMTNSLVHIGRGKKVQIDITNAFAEYASVSTIHARIIWDGRRYMLEDLRSTNGTYINQRKIAKPIPLRRNDTISIGSVDFIFAPQDHKTAKVLMNGVEREAQYLDGNVRVVVLLGTNSIPLNKEWTRIGRNPSSEIVLDAGEVSWNHAELLWNNNVLYVRDLGSSNGTFWNGKRVTVPVAIDNSGQLRCGNADVFLQFSSTPQSSSFWVLSNNTEQYRLVPNTNICIGRATQNDWVILDNSVSSQHAMISWDKQIPIYTDMGSSNGTILNQKRIVPHTPHVLSHGTVLLLGDVCVTVSTSHESGAQKVSSPVSQERVRVFLHSTHASVATIELQEGESIVVGRDPTKARWVQTENSVSSVHGVFAVQQGRVQYKDLGSTNGSFVGGQRITDWVLVSEKTTICLGEHCQISLRRG